MLAALTVSPPHPFNWLAGWGFILLAFLTGAGIGLFFHKPGFLGGYDALPRRMLRLGHIALAALGMLNILFGLSPQAVGAIDQIASISLLAGAASMPTVCFLTAWRTPARHLFFIPVLCLTTAVVVVLIGGLS